MITLGRYTYSLPAVPAQVIDAFRPRGIVHIVPEIFRQGSRGPSSYLFPADGSDLMAFIPSFGPNPWAMSPEALVAHLMEAGLTAVLVCAPPGREQISKMAGELTGEAKPYMPTIPEPVAAAASKVKVKPSTDADQFDLFGAAA